VKLEKTVERLEVRGSCLSGSVFDDVNISGASFENANMSGWMVNNANLAGLRVTNADVAGVQIADCRNVEHMVINGIAVGDLLAAYEAQKAYNPSVATLVPSSARRSPRKPA
jgi:hypothetical protein